MQLTRVTTKNIGSVILVLEYKSLALWDPQLVENSCINSGYTYTQIMNLPYAYVRHIHSAKPINNKVQPPT